MHAEKLKYILFILYLTFMYAQKQAVAKNGFVIYSVLPIIDQAISQVLY